jgi:hypothetical protein
MMSPISTTSTITTAVVDEEELLLDADADAAAAAISAAACSVSAWHGSVLVQSSWLHGVQSHPEHTIKRMVAWRSIPPRTHNQAHGCMAFNPTPNRQSSETASTVPTPLLL